jgi:hypothetical protein
MPDISSAYNWTANNNHNVRLFARATIVSGRHVTENSPQTSQWLNRVSIAANSTDMVLQTRPMSGTNWSAVNPAVSITQAQLLAFVNFINQNSYDDQAHRGVLTNATWRGFYNVAPRALVYVDHAGAPAGPPAPLPDTVPCYDCGLVHTLDNISIDHQRPIGGNPYEAICKVFRALGLTRGTVQGPKGAHFQAIHMAAVGGVASVSTARADKYTLNTQGEIYYSLFFHRNMLQELAIACMNHIINLRPLCNGCNTPNRNTSHYP